MAADDGRGSQRGERQSASAGRSNTNNSARGDARESRSQEASRSASSPGNTGAPSRGSSGAGTANSGTRSGNTNNGQNSGREARGGSGADGRGSQRSTRESATVGRGLGTSTGSAGRTASTGGLAGAAGLGQVGGSGVTSTYQGRPASVAREVARPTGLSGMAGVGRPDAPISRNVARSTVPSQSFRVAENLSMSKLANLRAPSFRATEEQATAKEDAWQDALSMVRAPEAGTTDPYNRLVNKKSGAAGYADLSGMTIGEVRALQKAMKASGQYPSDAIGAYQFIGGTLDEAVKRTGLPETAKFTAATQDYLARDLWANRAAQATTEDGTVNPTRFANRAAAEWASFQQQNGVGRYDGDGVNHASVKASTVKSATDRLIGTGAVGSGEPTQTRAIGRQMNAPAARVSMVERMATTYLGRPASVASTVARNNMAREQPSPASSFPARPAGPISQNPNAGYTPRAADPSFMSDAEQAATFGELPGGAPNLPSPAQPTSPDATPVSPTYTAPRAVSPSPAGSEPVSTVPSTTVPAVTSTPVSPAEETSIKTPLSTPQKIAAGAIDVGVGMIPGVGIGATIYNGLAAVAGLPTVGGMAVNLLGDGSNLGTGGPRRSEAEGGRRQGEQPEPKEAETTVKQPEVERFRERYLIPTVRRQTPAEKWGRRRLSA